MAQVNVSIRMDEELKKKFEKFCSEVGMSLTTAICVFAKEVVKTQEIPFRISTHNDPFYSESNVNFIHKSVEQLDRGQVVVKSMDELEKMRNE